MKYLKQVFQKRNIERAIAQVRRNKGSAGVDGMTVGELPAFFNKHGKTIIRAVEEGRYQPHGVKGIEIPKPNGGTRLLGIPTAVDRVIQQAIHQVLSPVYEQEFSSHSYGFRPKKSARQAVHQALAYKLIRIDYY